MRMLALGSALSALASLLFPFRARVMQAARKTVTGAKGSLSGDDGLPRRARFVPMASAPDVERSATMNTLRRGPSPPTERLHFSQI